MAFEPSKNWQDLPDGWQPGDPIPEGARVDAAALDALEHHLADYVDERVAAVPGGGGGGGPVAIPDVTGLSVALALLQDKATATTDAELSAAVSTLNGALTGKQDAANAATDAELAAAVATINGSLSSKQDASLAATDTELAAAVTTINAALGAKASQAALDAHAADTLLHPKQLGYISDDASDFVTTSSAPVDVTGMTRTVTVGARPVRVTFEGMVSSTVAGTTVLVLILRDGVQLRGRGAVIPAANGSVPITLAALDTGAAPGSHTYKVQIYVVAGGGNAVVSGISAPNFKVSRSLLVEEVAA